MCDKHDWSMKLVTRILVPCVSRFPCSLHSLSLSLSLSLSFSLTSVFWHALCVPTCRIGCNSTCPFGRKKRPGRSSLPGRNRYPSNFFLFFSFAWVIDRGPVPAVFACFFLCLIVRSLSRRQARVKDARVSR